MPRVPGEEGKKKEPPAYMGDPNATSTAEYVRSWLHLLGAAAYGGASMHELRRSCMARLSSACGVQYTTLRRLAACTRAQHAARCEIRSRCGTNSDVECTGALCDLAGDPEYSAAAKKWQKREWTFAGLSAHTYRLSSASRCVLSRSCVCIHNRSCRMSRTCRGSRWLFVGAMTAS